MFGTGFFALLMRFLVGLANPAILTIQSSMIEIFGDFTNLDQAKPMIRINCKFIPTKPPHACLKPTHYFARAVSTTLAD